jgi:hypothetical protein
MSEVVKESRFEQAESAIKKLLAGALKLALIVLFSVIAWRIAWSDFTLDLSKFDFSDLLALILALFAMGMSVAFYFKSTDSSNQFYDNIYNFTQKTSEILGRIEERFGEQLRHLDEGYGRIQSRFEIMPKTPDEIQEKVKETEVKEEKEKQRLEETNNAMREMMETLAERAKLAQKEKEEFYEKIGELAAEKDMAQERIRVIESERDNMQEQLVMMEEDMQRGIRDIRSPIIDKILNHPELRNLIRNQMPLEMLQKHSRRVFSEFPMEYIHRLQEEGIVNENRGLTKAGYLMLRTILRRYR